MKKNSLFLSLGAVFFLSIFSFPLPFPFLYAEEPSEQQQEQVDPYSSTNIEKQAQAFEDMAANFANQGKNDLQEINLKLAKQFHEAAKVMSKKEELATEGEAKAALAADTGFLSTALQNSALNEYWRSEYALSLTEVGGSAEFWEQSCEDASQAVILSKEVIRQEEQGVDPQSLADLRTRAQYLNMAAWSRLQVVSVAQNQNLDQKVRDMINTHFLSAAQDYECADQLLVGAILALKTEGLSGRISLTTTQPDPKTGELVIGHQDINIPMQANFLANIAAQKGAIEDQMANSIINSTVQDASSKQEAQEGQESSTSNEE